VADVEFAPRGAAADGPQVAPLEPGEFFGSQAALAELA
jgi:hypothetical protein